MYNLNSVGQKIVINQPIYELDTSRHNINPQCIVIGCKNGENKIVNKSVKFYQVPNLATSNAIARQWYINTLREDLLENILQTKQAAQHFVCIDHFDEESFLIAKDPCQDPSNVIMILKEDAVPSLFEIEVFQKMIAHQEQFTLNQQKFSSQSKQLSLSQNKSQTPLLQNLILNSDPQPISIQTNKRTRIDPDTRAALIQRIPKAVKRTALLNFSQDATNSQGTPKLQKALKQTCIKAQQPQMPSELNKNKVQKAVKHTSSLMNSIFKDMLPPPIMQSTKRNNSSIFQNKAVKHTSPVITNANHAKQPLTQVNQNSVTPTSGNKITITTTYVYKRVLQAPEIDLNLECEEEEIVYVKAPPKPAPKIEESEKELEKIENPKETFEKKNIENLEINNQSSKDDSEKKSNTKELDDKSKCEPKTKQRQVNTVSKSENTISYKPPSDCFNEFAKFYSRRLGAIKTSVTTRNTNKKTNSSYLPIDLRPGNYPAKCNICDLILENNIELTSHICSHLESNDLSTDQNIYISPFDAVTTTCGVCDTQFNNPFQLIKHLDSAHMKQLSEYKCRICEKQHDKLSDLIEHLNKHHSEQEMPYRCDACGFRTSFYADAIYHIKKEHPNTLRHFCPYCLKSLVLPFNKKLGHVQCNIFYSHLITHFNKHENDQIIPSKCKHCTKCILHIRHMKEHLVFDHNSIIINEEKSSDDEKKEDYDDKIELDLVNAEKDLKKRSSNKTSKAVDAESKSNAQINLRKRKRSLNEARNESENEASEDDSVKLDELESEVKLDDALKDKLKAEGRVKTKRKTSEYSYLIKKAQTLKSSKNESVEVKTDDLKEEPNSPLVEEPVVYKKKQKALKQTNVRPNMQRRRFRSSNFVLDRDLCQVDSSNSQHLSALIYGSLRFSCEKAQFKCIECGDSDLKSHYRTEYECHQCKYNTSCSKAFEYHLHGHLVRKRVALWNKSQKIPLEEYNCPCGFEINSEKDNKSNSNTGNRVAEHLMNCEYKYCFYKSQIDVNEDVYMKKMSIQNLGNIETITSQEKLNKSDEIILDSSNDDITEI